MKRFRQRRALSLLRSCVGRKRTTYQPRLEPLEGRDLPSLFGPPSFLSAAAPGSVVAADFNGKSDLAVVDTGNHTVSLFLGNGDGTFAPPTTLAAGADPVALAVGDFNRDFKSDLAVVNGGPSGSVTILRGNGDGTFATAGTYAVGPDPVAVALAAGYFSSPQDLAVADTGDDTVRVLRANGDGTYAAGATLAVGTRPAAVTFGDLNLDGTPDVIVADADANKVSIFLNNGNGTYAPPTTLAVGARPVALAVTGDYAGPLPLPPVSPGQPPDPAATLPRPRLFVANAGDGTVSVIGRDAAGALTVQQTVPVGGRPAALLVENLTGDDLPDIAVADQAGGRVAVCAGNAGGTFAAPMYFKAGPGPVALVGVSLNGDAAPDLVTADQAGDNLAVLINTAATRMTLQASTDHALAGQPVTFTVTVSVPPPGTDFPTGTVTFSDGSARFAPVPLVNGSATLTMPWAPGHHYIGAYFTGTGGYYGSSAGPVALDVNSDSAFTWPITSPAGLFAYVVTLGDFNGDGRTDVAVANDAMTGGGVNVLLGNGDGSFKAPIAVGGVDDAAALAVADFNGDGKLDLVAVSWREPTVSIFLGNGDGTFAPPITFALGQGATAVAVGDFNGDGKPDLVLLDASNPSVSNTVSVLLGKGDGTFLPAQTYVVGRAPEGLAVGDFNGDGKLDLAVTSGWDHNVSILLGRGDGTFAPRLTFATGKNSMSVVAADFNGDGKLDLAVGNSNDYSVSLFRGNGDGTFALQSTVPLVTGEGSVPLAVGDFNGDGRPDLMTSTNATVSILLNEGDGRFAPARRYAITGGGGYGVNAGARVVGDVNGDGLPDFVAGAWSSGQISVLLNQGGTTMTLPAAPGPATVAVGAGAGGGPAVRVYNADGSLRFNFFAYAPGFTGGVRVAVGDVNGDGVPDIITAPGPGGGPDIHVYDGQTGQLLRQFWAFDPQFTGGVNVAAGDVNGHGYADIIVGADAGGGPQVRVFSGKDGSLLDSFFAFDPRFTGGVRVAAGDVTGDGKADIITAAGPGGGPSVAVFNGADGTLLHSFFAFDSRFSGGVWVAAGGPDASGKAEIVAGAGAEGGPAVAVFDGDGMLLDSFLAYAPGFTGGVRVGAVRQSDGQVEIVTAAGPGGGPEVRDLGGHSLAALDEFFALAPQFTGGLFVAGGL